MHHLDCPFKILHGKLTNIHVVIWGFLVQFVYLRSLWFCLSFINGPKFPSDVPEDVFAGWKKAWVSTSSLQECPSHPFEWAYCARHVGVSDFLFQSSPAWMPFYKAHPGNLLSTKVGYQAHPMKPGNNGRYGQQDPVALWNSVSTRKTDIKLETSSKTWAYGEN